MWTAPTATILQRRVAMMVAGLGGSADLPSEYRFLSIARSACAFLTGSAWLEGTDRTSRESVASFAGQRLLDDRFYHRLVC